MNSKFSLVASGGGWFRRFDRINELIGNFIILLLNIIISMKAATDCSMIQFVDGGVGRWTGSQPARQYSDGSL